jgi:hypothetical protein
VHDAPAPPYGYAPPPRPRYQEVTGLAGVLVGLLALQALCLVAAFVEVPFAALIETVLLLPTAPVFVVWLMRARSNTEGIGARHQLPKWMAIVGWIIPLGNVYLPLRYVLDVLWAQVAPEKRTEAALAVFGWWLCWSLAWFTSIRVITSTSVDARGNRTTGTNVSMYIGSTVPSMLCLIGAAVLLAVVVRGISQRQRQFAAQY